MPNQCCTFSRTFLWGFVILSPVGAFEGGLTTSDIMLADALKYVDGQHEVEEICKTLRYCPDKGLGFSVDEERMVGKDLLNKFPAESIS